MISKNEYIHLCIEAKKLAIEPDPERLGEYFEISKQYFKYAREVHYKFIQPNHDLDVELPKLITDLQNICDEYKIKVKFSPIERYVYESGVYCMFYETVITNSEIEFDEQSQRIQVNITELIDTQPGKKEFKYK